MTPIPRKKRKPLRASVLVATLSGFVVLAFLVGFALSSKETPAQAAVRPDRSSASVSTIGPLAPSPPAVPSDGFLLTPAFCRRAGRKRKRGAIYARFSSRFQHSTADQLRSCLEWAKLNEIDVLDVHQFVDEKKTGKKRRRPGFTALREALARSEIDCVIIFTTSRLFRKTYQSLRFVEEEIIDRQIRCVFVKSGIDTEDKENWRKLMNLHSLVDEMSISIQASHIRAAHEGQLKLGVVFGTLTYGYGGEPIVGQTTKLGRPSRKLAVDPVTSIWVRKIFSWFVDEDLSIAEIVRRLNDPAVAAPVPDRSQTQRWTFLVVRRILQNSRYIGRWRYGSTEAVWQNKADYSRQFDREKPLLEIELPTLRLIDDRTWAVAQRKLADYLGRAGRKRKASSVCQPKLLNRICVCEKHQRPLHAGGTNNAYLFCPDCRLGPDRALVSLLPRQLATRLLCEKLAALIREDVGGLSGRVVASCRLQAESMQQTDPAELEDQRRREQQLTQQIRRVMTAVAHTERDEAESMQIVADLRRDRAAVEAQIERLEAQQQRKIDVPSVETVEKMMNQLADVLIDAAASGDDRSEAAVKRIIEAITGGKIAISQQGEAKAKRGWLRGTFAVRLLRPICDSLGMVSDGGDETKEYHIDFRSPTQPEVLADAAKELWDQGKLVKEIAVELSRTRSNPVGRAMVKKALLQWFQSRNLPLPDGRTRRKELTCKALEPALSAKIAEDVMALVSSGVLYVEIAERLKVDRNTVTAAIEIWHTSRGLPVPDGRSRRKALDHKSRPLIAIPAASPGG